MHQKACEIGSQTEATLTVRVSAASPSRRSHHVLVLFSARTLLFLVDPEKSSLGATVPQRWIVAQIRRTNQNRRPYTRTTGAAGSGSFLRRTCQTLNASKSVRNWIPNRGDVDSACLGREPEPPFGPRASGRTRAQNVPKTLQDRMCWACMAGNVGTRSYDDTMPIGMIAHARIRVYHAGDPAAPSCEKEEGGHVRLGDTI